MVRYGAAAAVQGSRLFMVMVMVFNSAYTGPLPRYLWCSSGAAGSREGTKF